MISTQLRAFTRPEAKATSWLLPQGELVLLEGPADIGKSLLASAWAAQVSQQEHVTIHSASPPATKILATHLAQHQPNYDRLHELSWFALRMPEERKLRQTLIVLEYLETHLKEQKPALLVIDSLEEAFNILSGEPEVRLRNFGARLAELARQHDCTILVLCRPTGRRGSARVARSVSEAARLTLSLAWHPGDASLRILPAYVIPSLPSACNGI